MSSHLDDVADAIAEVGHGEHPIERGDRLAGEDRSKESEP